MLKPPAVPTGCKGKQPLEQVLLVVPSMISYENQVKNKACRKNVMNNCALND